MTIADQARNQALSLEAKKDALTQRQSGDWKISFTVQGIDMDPRLTQAAMGTRYAMVLVEIGDDELPVQKEARTAKPLPDSGQATAGAKRNWREMTPQQQAGIRIGEPSFAAYLRETYPDEWRETQDADACLKMLCGGISSKREIETNHMARTFWHGLDRAYAAWKALEHA